MLILSFYSAQLINKINMTDDWLYFLPSPVTTSPSLKLCLGFSMDHSDRLNCSIPSRNRGSSWSLLLFTFFRTSLSTVGVGCWKASNPGKKRKILSATSWAGSWREKELCSLNTYETQDQEYCRKILVADTNVHDYSRGKSWPWLSIYL